MTPYQQNLIKEQARADYARSPALQNEFSTPEEFACYIAAVERGAVQGKERKESGDPAKNEFRRIWDSCPQFHHLHNNDFESAWRQHLAAESARCCPGLHGVKPTIYARSGQ